MSHRWAWAFILFASAVLLVAAKPESPCECSNNTVLGRFEEARFVVIAKVVSAGKVSEASSGEKRGSNLARMVVDKVYKGNLNLGDEMVFGQGVSGSCLLTFDERDVGTKFLFYLRPKENTPAIWYAEGCGRSKPLPHFVTKYIEDAADDLSYLEKIDKVRNKTRISGTLISYAWSSVDGGADFSKMAGRKVHVVGAEKTYEAETNEDGVYEIYDLPPGRYTVNPEIPKGWKVENPSAFGGGGSGGREDGERQVTLRAGRHAYFDFFVKVDNTIRGRVFDPFGKPMKRVCVDLSPTQGKISEYFRRVDCTKEDGSFEMDEIPFGNYVMVVNKDDKISSNEPFRRFYYPDVYEREKATVITINEGDVQNVIDVRVPEVKEVVTIEGTFRSSDGKPVTRAIIYFRAEETDTTIEGSAFAVTDENGKFSIRVLKGLKGKLLGKVSLDESEFKACPQVVALLKGKGKIDWRDQETEAIENQTQNSLDHVELRLPFPGCKEAKIVSRIKVD